MPLIGQTLTRQPSPLSCSVWQTSVVGTTPTAGIARQPAAAAIAADNDGLPRQTGSRRGRPLGKTTSPRLLKEKVTLRLSSPLVASYRDWSWEARSQFSHLVERALTDYYQRQRHPDR
jgi:hypothetical protein